MDKQPSTMDTLLEESYAAGRCGNIGHAFREAQAALEEARAAGQDERLADALACMAYMQTGRATGDQFPYADGAALLELLRRVTGKPEAGCASPLIGSVTDRAQQE